MTSEYLNELRKRLIWVFVFFFIATMVGITFSKQIVRWFLALGIPENVTLVTLSPYESIALFFNVIILLAFSVTLPFLLYQGIMFVRPGLTKKEKALLLRVPVFAIILFGIGAVIGFYLTKHFILDFLAGLTVGIGVENLWSASQFITFYLYAMFFMGVIFEMPLLACLLISIGLITPEHLTKHRKHMVISLLVLSAVLTPTTDALSMLVMVLPLLLLYEFTIILTKILYRKKKEE